MSAADDDDQAVRAVVDLVHELSDRRSDRDQVEAVRTLISGRARPHSTARSPA
ncbi:hypothetical protein Q9R32_00495 [Actinotalea sp. AC32]|nr:hypothetical protein [Actinotalea sp. AC32]